MQFNFADFPKPAYIILLFGLLRFGRFLIYFMRGFYGKREDTSLPEEYQVAFHTLCDGIHIELLHNGS